MIIVKQSKLIILLLPFLIISCASYHESAGALRDIHKTPVIDSSLSKDNVQLNFMEYAPSIEIDGYSEEIEDPVGFCFDCLEDLTDYDFSDEFDKSCCVCILSMTSIKSPSMLVRARALQTLRTYFKEEDTAQLIIKRKLVDEQEFENNLQNLLILHDKIAPDKGLNPEEKQFYLSLLRYFGSSGYLLRAGTSWKTLTALCSCNLTALDEDLKAAWNETLKQLNIQTFYNTVIDSFKDPEHLVRQTAISLFFLFPFNLTRPDLEGALQYNFYMMSTEKYPMHRIQIIQELMARVKNPEELGLKLIGSIASNLGYSHSGVAHHATQLLSKITLIDNDDPLFWGAWWKEYLLKHADRSNKIN